MHTERLARGCTSSFSPLDKCSLSKATPAQAYKSQRAKVREQKSALPLALLLCTPPRRTESEANACGENTRRLARGA